MKKLITITLVLIIALSVLTGCGRQSNIIRGDLSENAQNVETTEPDPAPVEPDPVETEPEEPADAEMDIEAFHDLIGKTIGDVMAYGSEEYQAAAYETVYVYAFKLNDIYYRVFAPMTEEDFNSVMELDYADPDYDAKYNAIIEPLEIERFENLSAMMPTQEELDALIGQTGEDLLNAGWDQFGYNLHDMQYYMSNGLFRYTVTFEGQLDDPDRLPDGFEAYEFLKPLVVKSFAFECLGDATEIELPDAEEAPVE